MNLSIHKPASLSDPTWIKEYIAKLGEDKFWRVKYRVYKILDDLDVGQWISVEKWAKDPANYDLFIKLACFYVSESECCYQFNNEYTIITHKYNINETMVPRSTKIRVQAHS